MQNANTVSAKPIPINARAMESRVNVITVLRPTLSDREPAKGAVTAPTKGPIPRSAPIMAGPSPNDCCNFMARNESVVARAMVTSPDPAMRNRT
ncbi:hypothetical protein D9M69_619380 [compost metagenome]